MDLFDLKGEVAIVTGASSGLGKRFALVLAEYGADVAIMARRYERLETLAQEIEAKGVKCLALKCDVASEADIIAGVEKVKKTFGKIDILVNNAGISIGAPAEEMSSEIFDNVMNVNTRACFLMARECAKIMIPQKYGKIINISSMFGLVGNNFFPVVDYHTSKGALVQMSRALAVEWAPYGILVNAMCPGFFESEMTDAAFHMEAFQDYVKRSTPLRRTGLEEELDTTLLYLVSRKTSYTTGQVIAVDGGWTAM